MLKILLAVVITMTLGLYGTARGADYKDPATGMEFVFVKGGCFQMWDIAVDDNKEEGRGKVCVDDFYIGKYEVTQGQWKALTGNNPSIFKDCGNNCPVEGVSWDDAKEFTNLLNKKTVKKYRLPYEAEWEYAARSRGKNEKWSGTSDEKELQEFAWYEANSGKKPHPVGQKKPNSLGVYDMSGNVWEWMEDKYFKNDKLGNWEYCVLRGGSWNDSSDGLRFVSRNVSRAIETDLSLGFRVAFPAR